MSKIYKKALLFLLFFFFGLTLFGCNFFTSTTTTTASTTQSSSETTTSSVTTTTTTSSDLTETTATTESTTSTTTSETSEITSLLIFEVYGGGGNVGAVYRNDYIVLYNKSSSSIDLSAFSIQYSSATSTTYYVIPLTGFISAESYFLISLFGGANGSALPVGVNQTSSMNLAVSAGKIALVSDQTAIFSATDDDVIDFLGYGSAASEYETSPTAALSSSLSAKRTVFSDSNSNLSDFTVSIPDLSYIAATVTLTSISVSGLDDYYSIGENLNLAGALLVLHYSNESIMQIPLNPSMVSGFSSTTMGDFSLSISYESFTIFQEYHISDFASFTHLDIHYIDIGSTGGGPGEATLVQIGDIDILIDAGEPSAETQTALLDFLSENVTDGTIEYIVATHQDADHIGNFVAVMSAYEVTNAVLYSTPASIATATRRNFETAVASEGCAVYYAYDLANQTDPTITLAPGVTIEFFDTTYLTSANANDSSLVFVLEAWNTRVLFNGDSESSQEAVYAPLVGAVNFFKMGHHGAGGGTTSALLEAITPEVAIVSNGDFLGNEYNHPTYAALSRIYAYSNMIPVYAVTGGNGTGSPISYQRNGTITVTISALGYQISSANYENNPMELSHTDYWNSPSNPYRSSGYYYATSTGISDKSALKDALSLIIDGHTSYSYAQIVNILKITDADPNVPGNVILFYSNRSQSAETYVSSTNNQDYWNREHIWAQSHGIDNALPGYTDLHHIRVTDVSINGARGDLDFGIAPIHNSTTRVGALTEYGTVLSYCYMNGSYFEPRDEIKGDVARMLFYMATRYEGNNGEIDLELVNGTTTTTSSNLGDLATLLLWNEQDPVSQEELLRNNIVYSYQGNRNPFIDHPELVDLIWG